MGLPQAAAQPVGAAVIAGQAQVSTSGATTIINQATNKAIINWQDFSVGTGASVQFNQPNSASITLNRVTGANISNIDGAVRANGQVWLLNPNGVLFGNNARINVGGLLATTSDIANQDFLEGRYNFTGGKNSIINKGSIQASSGGSVVLSAPNVANHGLIQANAGHVVLGGTDTFTVDFNGDRLLSYAVGANSSGGKVTNTGKISAPGGQILLTARAAAGVQEAVINNTGMVEATSVREENGEIVLEAEDGGVANSGTLDASGKGAGETGGTVKLLGKDIAVTDGARIDVSGDAGGGTALIGGNFQGKGSEQHAQTTTIGKASIKADAISRGNGGKVAVWSDGTTKFAGSISARGGAASGNGGQVETSGHDLAIAPGATVNALAPFGASGGWLLDPANIIIANSGTDPATTQTFTQNFSGTATISPTSIDAALQTANLSLQASNDITLNDPLTISSAGTAGRTLTLEAGRSIILNQAITYSGGNIVMIAASQDSNVNATYRGMFPAVIKIPSVVTASQLDLILNSDGLDGSSIGWMSTPAYIGNGTNLYVKTLNANVFLTSNPATGTLLIGNSGHALGLDAGTGMVMMSGGNIQQSAPINAGFLSATVTSTAGWISLGTAANTVGMVNLAAPGAVSFYNAGNLSIGGIRGLSGANAGSLNLQATGTITLANAGSTPTIATSGATVLHAGGSILQGTGTSISAQSVSLISDNGTLGLATTPLSLSTSGLSASTLSRDMFFSLSPFNSGTSVLFNSVTLNADGQISAVNTAGVNAGLGGNVQISAPSLAVNSFTNTQNGTFSVTANNFQVGATSVSINGATVNSLSASTTGDITFNNSQALQLNNLAGGAAIATSGSVTLDAAGSITQFAAANGRISVGGALTATVSGFNAANGILFNNPQNAITGTVALAASGPIVLFNSLNTTLGRAAIDNAGSGPALTVDIEVFGAGNTLTLSGQGTVINANGVTLHADGNIVGNTGVITGSQISLISNTGSVGTSEQPLVLRGNTTLAVQAGKDVTLNGATSAVNGAAVVTSLTIGSVANLGPSGYATGAISGITAGGAVNLFLAPYNVSAPATITASNLAVVGNSISLDNIAVTTVSARSQTGTIDISSSGSFQINNFLYGTQSTVASMASTNTFAGIQTTGAVFLNSDNGTITQASGAAGAIKAGSLSAFAFAGNTLTNTANAITGNIQFGSFGEASLYNSIDTHIAAAVANGTLTIQSGGDLELVKGPSIGDQLAASAIDNTSVLGALNATSLGGIVLSLKAGGDGVVLVTPGKFINNFGATAVLVPGSRFLIYSADPKADTFGGLKAVGAGIFGTSFPTAITALGNRYVFSVAGTIDTSFINPTPVDSDLSQDGNTAVVPTLAGFVAASQSPSRTVPPPPPPSGNGLLEGAGSPPPPPPPPPPGGRPLAAMSGPDGGSGELPSSSDQTTSFVASSLEGGPAPIVSASNGPIIPRYLTAQPNLPIGILQDPTLLPGLGNLSLWQ